MTKNADTTVEVIDTRLVTTLPSGYDFQVVFTSAEAAEEMAAKVVARHGFTRKGGKA